MKRTLITLAIALVATVMHAKTLVVYYSYTNNVHNIVTELTRQIDADVVRIQPAEKGLDYAANNYAIGSAQISAIRNNPDDAASYPAIDPVDVNFSQYNCIIIGAPLWWSNMAAPLQTYLFQNGKAMAGKKIGLIVSSASSGISGVEGDAKRLIPDGDFFAKSLWIRSSQTSNAPSLIRNWLDEVDYDTVVGSGVSDVSAEDNGFSISVNGMAIDVTQVSDDSIVEIYDVKGKNIYRGRQHQIKVPDNGLYLVKVNSVTKKIML